MQTSNQLRALHSLKPVRDPDPKINVVLRTCDRFSLQSDRMVDKKECVLRCTNSLLTNLQHIKNKHLHIIDDASSRDLVDKLLAMTSSYDFVTLDLLPQRDQTGMSDKKKSRYSVEMAYKYIYALPDHELVYTVEDDYLHRPGSIREMIDTWRYLDSVLNFDIGIFPQDFNQLYFEPSFSFNNTYVEKCMVVPTPKRYYRTTWFTHESFMIESNIFKQFRQQFDKLLTIGDNDGNWEGNTISNVWTSPGFAMFMPLGSLVIHLSKITDIPFFTSAQELLELWENNKTSWSSEQESQVRLWPDSLPSWVTWSK